MKRMPRSGSEAEEFSAFVEGVLDSDMPCCIFAVQMERISTERGDEIRAKGQMVTVNVPSDHMTVDLLRALAHAATREADVIEGVQR